MGRRVSSSGETSTVGRRVSWGDSGKKGELGKQWEEG